MLEQGHALEVDSDRLRDKDMKIAVRLDDITPAMDWDKFQAFASLLDWRGAG